MHYCEWVRPKTRRAGRRRPRQGPRPRRICAPLQMANRQFHVDPLPRLLATLQDLPDLRNFDCLTCGDPWPCHRANAQLRQWPATRRGELLGVTMALAAKRLPAEGLYARFLGQVRQA